MGEKNCSCSTLKVVRNCKGEVIMATAWFADCKGSYDCMSMYYVLLVLEILSNIYKILRIYALVVLFG